MTMCNTAYCFEVLILWQDTHVYIIVFVIINMYVNYSFCYIFKTFLFARRDTMMQSRIYAAE